MDDQFIKLNQINMDPNSGLRHSSRLSILNQFGSLVRWQKAFAFFILSMSGSGLGGCFDHYYQTNTVHSVDASTVQNLIKSHKYFILHTDAGAYALSDIKVSNEFLDGKLDSLARDHEDYLDPKRPERNRIIDKGNEDLFYEVHIYPQASEMYSSPVHIPLKAITRMDIYSLDAKHTKRAMVESIAGLTLVTAGVVGLIVAAGQANHSQPTPAPNGGSTNGGSGLKCSPQVFVLDSQNTFNQGTLCSGAIYASLERTDYMPLAIPNPVPDELQMLIRGEKNEELMFNKVQLLEVTHPRDQRVLIDRKGKVIVYEKPVAPIRATIGQHEKNILGDIISCDNKFYSFTNDSHGQSASDLVLEFRKPMNVQHAKLIIRAKNSPWAFYLFGQFKALYGASYTELIHKKDLADPNKVLQCELDQYLPLLVSLKEDGEWKYVDYFATPGNSGPRDLIMDLDLSHIKKADRVEVRLQTAYFFWDLDYAAMDFSQSNEYALRTLSASKIFISGQGMETKKVGFATATHLTLSDNELLNLEFHLDQKVNANQQISYFLVGKGYYHDNTRFEGKANIPEITKFSGKGAFDQYSRQKFEDLVKVLKENKREASVKTK